MKNFKFKIKNVKLSFALMIIVSVVLIMAYYILVFSPLIAKYNYTNQMVEIADENESSVFNIQRILLYSSANAIDNSENQSLSNMSISQFSDICIYIDNSPTSTDLTDENTIKELYIDNISISTNSQNGTKILNYKNPFKFGKYADIEKPANDRIDFNIINTNEENENNDYDKPTFYADCSNPISLGFLDKDLLTNYSVTDSANTISFNGKVLQEANISLEDITPTISFTIHIINNQNEKFAYNMNLTVDINGIYDGYAYKAKTTSGIDYQFFKEINNL